MYSLSTKTKFNTASSTKSKVVAVGEKLPKSTWLQLFCIAQGGYAKEYNLMQNNQSTILLSNNGWLSFGKGSKHIGICYFFITDHIEKKHIEVHYCPTLEMIADFITKPLQGVLFYMYQNAVLGVNMDDVAASYKSQSISKKN